jgi:hypothetical protein
MRRRYFREIHMPFNFHDLTIETRTKMVGEIDLAISQGNLYLSGRVSGDGRAQWGGLIREAAKNGTEETLRDAILGLGLLNEDDKPSVTSKSGVKKMPTDAAAVLAEGEFNRFYIRGICLMATERGEAEVEVYRAKAVGSSRPESDAMIGQRLSASDFLAELRTKFGGFPPPNSGLSVRRIR